MSARDYLTCMIYKVFLFEMRGVNQYRWDSEIFSVLSIFSHTMLIWYDMRRYICQFLGHRLNESGAADPMDGNGDHYNYELRYVYVWLGSFSYFWCLSIRLLFSQLSTWWHAVARPRCINTMLLVCLFYDALAICIHQFVLNISL